MQKPRIGFIGMGIMGTPMAMHLSRADYDLTLYDKQRSSVEKAAGEIPRANPADSPKEVAQVSDIVVTMVPNGRVVREVALGEDGLIHGFQKGALLLDTSSSEPWLTMQTARALAKRGVDMVDAPVSGALTGAVDDKLVFMVGGEETDIARVRPLLEIMGEKIFHLGPIGSGHMMKCINNLITAMTFMATAEAMAVGKHFSLDPEAMIDVLNVSTGMSWISRTQFSQRIFNRKFDDPFKLELMVKDIGIALELAESQGIPAPLSSVGHHLWQAAARHAESGASISTMVQWVEYMTGIELVSNPDSENR
jgi:3-hydroxyisobutyrate dehydrogenase